ncbi:hypothetical protein NMU03_05885 [Allocoprobacillus halotolerans]|uniref:Polysaccharide biosynthesis protein C-terminal domain-containing protein n=1 Tax=Allocoprobacillus halotolerans TaxID=2944914 RepID=A0ABY5I4P1_9FIRM|nr:hypothetical protein [Allocoprobacillus halotolerans]UTY40314.1 hypothetical protein NMU03_05885 [Allocoprobacillus halotolerans]
MFCFLKPLLLLLGASLDTFYATSQYVLWNVIFGAVPSILNVVLAYLVRAEGQVTHASVGTMLGCMINIFWIQFS